MGNIIEKVCEDKTALTTGMLALGSIAYVIN